MRVLVACEYSGRVRQAFRERGHDAYSCDLLPAEDGETVFHIQDSFEHVIGKQFRIWDMIIAHPPCTYLTGAAAWALKDPDYDRYPGVGYHQKVSPDTLTGAARRQARSEAGEFAQMIWACSDKVAIENPRGGLSKFIKDGDLQEVQPHQFGEDASKATCFRFKGLPRLTPTRHVPPRMVDGRPRWGNQTDSGQNRLSPSKDRWKERSRTYQGIADAMADQWGGRS